MFRFMTFTQLIPTLLVSGLLNAHSNPKEPYCLTHHLQEAIQHNSLRTELYGQISLGQSIPISRKLIKLETKLLRFSRWFDNRCHRYHQQGLYIGCNELVSMDSVKNSPLKFTNKEDYQSDFSPLKIGSIKAQLYRALMFQGYTILTQKTNALLQSQALSNNTQLCLTRHLLESIRRASQFAQYYHSTFEAPPVLLPKMFIMSHIRLLAKAYEIDKLAHPLHQQGIAIICHDVPHIPAFPTF